MPKFDKFVKLGYAVEAIKPGERVEYLPTTGMVRKYRERDRDHVVIIEENGAYREEPVMLPYKEDQDRE